jgi:hypothetical protein
MIDLEHKQCDAQSAVPVDAASSRRARVTLVLLGLLGAGLVAAPLLFGMFSKAPQGATMLDDFSPFMTTERLHGFSGELELIDNAVTELDGTGAGRSSATYRRFSEQWPVIDEDMSGLMDDVTGSLDQYQAMAGLPSFVLFPWFFLGPGVVVLGFVGYALARRRWTRGAQVVVSVIAVALVAMPFAFGVFSKAPQGADMMRTFKTLETTRNVTRIQGYFSTMAVGQGAIRLDIVPALEKSGLTASQVAVKYPATTELNAGWVHILNDMTPMIGAMSDNVGHYEAISSLPAFGLFGWFFLIPGVLLLGLVVLVGRPRRFAVPQGDPR